MSTTKKPTINSEWDKIKDYKIFDSFEEFEALYNKRPGCKCFRKYTNYEWSKDNFFFGTYDELSEYYKTSLEVPFYLESHKNKKIGNITVLDFFIKIEKGSRSIYAKCKCDCGNHFEALYEAILKKNKRSCGCHNRKIKNTLFEFMPDLVEKEWDYDLNKDDPKKISVYSDEKYWWKDENGSYQMAPSDLIKKSMGTSLPEQVIYFYLKKIYPNTTNRFKLRVENKLYEADIFIPEKSIAIEYDGLLWHKDKGEKEKVKYINLKSKGISLIRIREEGLSFDKNTADINIERKIKNINDFDSLCNMYNDLLRELSQLCNEPSLINGLIQSELIHNDIVEILKQYKIGFEGNNISDTFLNEFWDYEKNENLRPRQISKTFEYPLYFKCKNNQSIQVAPKRMLERKQINELCCFIGVCCPCKENENIKCAIYDEYLYSKIKLYYSDKYYDRYCLNNFTCYTYKDNFKKLMLEDLNKLSKRKKFFNSEIEDFRFFIFNSTLVDIRFTETVINYILNMNIKKDFLLNVFDSFYLQKSGFYVEELVCLYNNKKLLELMFESVPSDFDLYNSLVEHFLYCIQNDNLGFAVQYIVKLMKRKWKESEIFEFLDSCFYSMFQDTYHKYFNLHYLDKILCRLKNLRHKGVVYLYLEFFKNYNNISFEVLKEIVFNACQDLFKKGSAFIYNKDQYVFKSEYDYCSILKKFLFNIKKHLRHENVDNKYYIDLISEIIVDNKDYFLNNTNALVCLTYSFPACDDIREYNTEYMRNKELINIALKSKCLNFLNYNILDLLPYYDEFLHEIKINCDDNIYFDRDWFQQEFLANINKFSTTNLRETLKTLNYISRFRNSNSAITVSSYIIEDLAKVKNVIRAELKERDKKEH